MIRNFVTFMALMAISVDARRGRGGRGGRGGGGGGGKKPCPKPINIGTDENGDGTIERSAAYCTGTFTTAGTTETFFIGISHAEGESQDGLLAWGKDLDDPIDVATADWIEYDIVLLEDNSCTPRNDATALCEYFTNTAFYTTAAAVAGDDPSGFAKLSKGSKIPGWDLPAYLGGTTSIGGYLEKYN